MGKKAKVDPNLFLTLAVPGWQGPDDELLSAGLVILPINPSPAMLEAARPVLSLLRDPGLNFGQLREALMQDDLLLLMPDWLSRPDDRESVDHTSATRLLYELMVQAYPSPYTPEKPDD